MEETLIAEIRQLLQSVVVPDLETLLSKLENIQQQLHQTQQSILSEIAAFRLEMDAVRTEMTLLRAEMRREAEPSIPDEKATVDPQRYLM